MSISSALMKLMAWAREAEKAANVERSAKYFYDASRALNRGELAAQSDAETERLIRAAQQGHNAVVMRFSDPARDERHLINMRDSWRDLPGEERGFHVDLTPGGPAAYMRMNNLRRLDLEPRPLSVVMRKYANLSDESANDANVLAGLRRKGYDSVVYSPVRGEMAPGRQGLYDSDAIEDFFSLQDAVAPGRWQPSAAILKPENVRDLFEAEFKKPKATGLGYARGGLAQVKKELSCGHK